ILLAGLYADGYTIVEEPFQSRDHTERMLEYFGADIKIDGRITSIKSGRVLEGKKIQIPGDISSAAFFIVLALLLKGSELTLKSIGINPTRRKIVDLLIKMGADIKIENEKKLFEPICDLKINASNLRGVKITEEEVPRIIDEIPILCVAAAQAEGVTEIRGVQELRVKETDRVFSMVDNLKRLGVDISSKNNNIAIKGRKKRFSTKSGTVLESYGDHRTAMAMCVGAAASDASCRICDIDCINTSFPEFFDIFNYVRR
ncbi:MAG: 3-phosphoshikimate 1-carboxyvinyltransferase, partial [Candidatus Omnitrophica bacterium]|nr:3-phosphoshikimate 1-carboxyvinyltransferase [Candidatus Omnitrophota bacterium]